MPILQIASLQLVFLLNDIHCSGFLTLLLGEVLEANYTEPRTR
jgi:hypothetical protein